MISMVLLAGGSMLLALGGALIASGLQRRQATVIAPVIVLDLRERSPVIDLTEVRQVWTASPASSSRRVR